LLENKIPKNYKRLTYRYFTTFITMQISQYMKFFKWGNDTTRQQLSQIDNSERALFRKLMAFGYYDGHDNKGNYWDNLFIYLSKCSDFEKLKTQDSETEKKASTPTTIIVVSANKNNHPDKHANDPDKRGAFMPEPEIIDKNAEPLLKDGYSFDQTREPVNPFKKGTAELQIELPTEKIKQNDFLPPDPNAFLDEINFELPKPSSTK